MIFYCVLGAVKPYYYNHGNFPSCFLFYKLRFICGDVHVICNVFLEKNDNFRQFFEKNVKFLAIFLHSNGNYGGSVTDVEESERKFINRELDIQVAHNAKGKGRKT